MRRDELYLADLVQATQIAHFLQEVDEKRWQADSLIRSAVMHQLTIIGEIGRALSPEARGRHPEIAWDAMRGFRNVVVHEYFAVDWRRVWLIVQRDVPLLARQALDVLRAEAPDVAREMEGQ